MPFEKENEERRKKEQIHANLLKWYGVKCLDEVFYVGSPSLNDPYSGTPIYVPPKAVLENIEAVEPETTDNIADMSSAEPSTSDVTSDVSDAELELANEIYQRLMAEAAADEMAKQTQIENLLREQELKEGSAQDYNAATGSYSGLYGKKPMNESEADALANIMNQNSSYTKSIEDLIRENQ